jgi:hypothetical protein
MSFCLNFLGAANCEAYAIFDEGTRFSFASVNFCISVSCSGEEAYTSAKSRGVFVDVISRSIQLAGLSPVSIRSAPLLSK